MTEGILAEIKTMGALPWVQSKVALIKEQGILPFAQTRISEIRTKAGLGGKGMLGLGTTKTSTGSLGLPEIPNIGFGKSMGFGPPVVKDRKEEEYVLRG